jgi:hypothetical protein
MSRQYWIGGIVVVVPALVAGYILLADPSLDHSWDITGFATFVLAATTAYLAFTTRAEAQATTAQVEISGTQLERSHRPVLAPTSVGPRVTELGGVEINYENVGMGPAVSIHVEINVHGWPKPCTVFEPALGNP